VAGSGDRTTMVDPKLKTLDEAVDCLDKMTEAIQRHHDERYGPVDGPRMAPYFAIDRDLYKATGVRTHGRP